MRRSFTYVLVIIALLLVGCASKEDKLVEGMARILDGAVATLEQHAESPEQGVAALDAYFTERQDDLSSLQTLADELDVALSSDEREALQGRLEKAIKPMEKRLDKVADAYASSEEALSSLKDLWGD